MYSGLFEGERLGLLYHGSGSFSVSTAIDELAALGVRAILRVGNSGGMRPDLKIGDLVICSGGIREDRVMLDYVPVEYPAVPSRHMVQAEIAAFESLEIPFKEGLTLSVGTMYPGSGFETARGVIDQTVLDRVHLWKNRGGQCGHRNHNRSDHDTSVRYAWRGAAWDRKRHKLRRRGIPERQRPGAHGPAGAKDAA